MTMKQVSSCHAAEIIKQLDEVKARLARREHYWRSQAGNSPSQSLGITKDRGDAEQERILDWMDNDPEIQRDREFIARVEDALDKLSKDHQDVLALSHMDGLSPEEVAKCLAMGMSTYWKRQKEALEAVAQELFGVFS